MKIEDIKVWMNGEAPKNNHMSDINYNFFSYLT